MISLYNVEDIMASQRVQLGARIPSDLKSKLMKFCNRNGIKMNYFVTKAIKEKLLEMAEDENDMKFVNHMRENDEYVTQKEMNKLYSKLGLKP
jgi:predicted DNA-binding protein